MKHPELRRHADQRQQVVEHAELRVEHHRPDQRDRDRRRHHRHDEDAAQQAAQREISRGRPRPRTCRGSAAAPPTARCRRACATSTRRSADRSAAARSWRARRRSVGAPTFHSLQAHPDREDPRKDDDGAARRPAPAPRTASRTAAATRFCRRGDPLLPRPALLLRLRFTPSRCAPGSAGTARAPSSARWPDRRPTASR